MPVVRYLLPAFVASLLWAIGLGAQAPTGTITGRVVDSTTQQENFQDYNYLYPIPQGEIDKSGGSITQNSGY